MKTKNNNKCSIIIRFYKNDEANELRIIELCSMEEAIKYIQEVITPNNWRFDSMERGLEYAR